MANEDYPSYHHTNQNYPDNHDDNHDPDDDNQVRAHSFESAQCIWSRAAKNSKVIVIIIAFPHKNSDMVMVMVMVMVISVDISKLVLVYGLEHKDILCYAWLSKRGSLVTILAPF